MNKPVILTTEGFERLVREIETIENSMIPLAKRDLKKAKLWVNEENIKKEKAALKGLKKRLSVLNSMLEEATRV